MKQVGSFPLLAPPEKEESSQSSGIGLGNTCKYTQPSLLGHSLHMARHTC